VERRAAGGSVRARLRAERRGRALPWTEEFMHQGAVDEDCLYLNVWTTSSRGARRPVLVYIYGGGFNEGSGSVAIYDGEALAKKGLVVVTFNYRVGRARVPGASGSCRGIAARRAGQLRPARSSGRAEMDSGEHRRLRR
jgi:hypothetical protein